MSAYDEGISTTFEAAGLEKQAILETARHTWKGLKGALIGGTNLQAPPGTFHAPRQRAVQHGQDLMDRLQKGGIKTHRARVKSPASIDAKGLQEVPDDLLGMQVIGKSPEDVKSLMEQMREAGVEIERASAKTLPGYHGINIKGRYQDTPLEMQVTPSRTSNFGNIVDHALSYKRDTEAPYANRIDDWVSKNIMPKLVNFDELRGLDPSWINERLSELAAMGIEV